MVISQTIEMEDMNISQICHHLEHKHYMPIQDSLGILKNGLNDVMLSYKDQEKLVLIEMLLQRLTEEIQQAIRNDLLVLFPLLTKGTATSFNRFPVKSVREKSKKIISILNKLRLVCENYIRKPGWDSISKMFFEEMYNLDRMVTDAVLVKENYLLPKIMVEQEDE